MKKTIALFSLFLIVLTVSFYSCKKKKKTTTTYSATCSSAVSYSVDVKPLIQSSCVGCHSSYSNYSSLKSSSSSVRSSVIDGSMPKGTSLSDAQKDKIICWIDAGAPNN